MLLMAQAEIPRRPMSAFGGKADIARTDGNVCFDPKRTSVPLPIYRFEDALNAFHFLDDRRFPFYAFAADAAGEQRDMRNASYASHVADRIRIYRPSRRAM